MQVFQKLPHLRRRFGKGKNMQKIKKGDNVQILSGKDRGKTGTVERVLSKEGKVLVPGVNIYKRHLKSRQGIEGGIVDLVKPMDISNVAVICTKCKKPTRIGFKVEGEEKKRICKKCQAIL